MNKRECKRLGVRGVPVGMHLLDRLPRPSPVPRVAPDFTPTTRPRPLRCTGCGLVLCQCDGDGWVDEPCVECGAPSTCGLCDDCNAAIPIPECTDERIATLQDELAAVDAANVRRRRMGGGR